jgi:hypothetical protein
MQLNPQRDRLFSSCWQRFDRANSDGKSSMNRLCAGVSSLSEHSGEQDDEQVSRGR